MPPLSTLPYSVCPTRTGIRVFVTTGVKDKDLLDILVGYGGGTGILEQPLEKQVELARKNCIDSKLISTTLNSQAGVRLQL